MAGFGTTAILITILIAALVAVPGLVASRSGRVGRMFRAFGKPPDEAAAAAPVRTPSSQFCTECGARLYTRATFCTQCGTRC